VSGLGIKRYADEDVDRDLAVQLRYHSDDALSCQEAGRNNIGRSDEDQLRFAHDVGRAVAGH